jgi:hypothetical protein
MALLTWKNPATAVFLYLSLVTAPDELTPKSVTKPWTQCHPPHAPHGLEKKTALALFTLVISDFAV